MTIEVSLSELRDFLYEAKQEWLRHNWLGSDFGYDNGDYHFIMTRNGILRPIRTEIVALTDVPIWGLCQMGGFNQESDELQEEALEILLQGLSKMPKKFPLRGTSFENDYWSYEFNTHGRSLELVSGHESVSYCGTPVYETMLIAGIVTSNEHILLLR